MAESTIDSAVEPAAGPAVDPVDGQVFVALAGADELWDGEMDAFDVDGREILVLRVDGEIHAYGGTCPHQSIPLVEGTFDGYSLTCRGHEWQFDVRTGDGINPKTARLARHDVKIVDGVVHVSRHARWKASASRRR